MNSNSNINAYIDAHKDRFLNELLDLLKIMRNITFQKSQMQLQMIF